MKNTVIQLKTGVSYYILEELVYNQKKYVMTVECNLDNDEMEEENLVMMEVKVENDNVIVDEIQDDNVALEVLKLFQKKFQSSDNE